MQNVLKNPLDLLDEFPSFPFRVKRDSEFLNLLASIKDLCEQTGCSRSFVRFRTASRFSIPGRICFVLRVAE